MAKKVYKAYHICLHRRLFSKSKAMSCIVLFTTRPVNVSSVRAARARTHIPGDISATENYPCSKMFSSPANISLCWRQRIKKNGMLTCVLLIGPRKNVDMFLLSIYFSYCATGGSRSQKQVQKQQVSLVTAGYSHAEEANECKSAVCMKGQISEPTDVN